MQWVVVCVCFSQAKPGSDWHFLQLSGAKAAAAHGPGAPK